MDTTMERGLLTVDAGFIRDEGDWDAFPITDHSWAHEDEDEEEQNE